MPQYIQITQNYRGRRTGEQLVTPGFYQLGDPGLHGMTQADIDYLVKEQRKAVIHNMAAGVEPGTVQAEALNGVKELKARLAEKGFDADALIAALTGQTAPGAVQLAGVPGESGESATEVVEKAAPPADPEPDKFEDMKADELKAYITAHGGVIPEHGEGSGSGGYVVKADLQKVARALPVPSDEAV